MHNIPPRHKHLRCLVGPARAGSALYRLLGAPGLSYRPQEALTYGTCRGGWPRVIDHHSYVTYAMRRPS